MKDEEKAVEIAETKEDVSLEEAKKEAKSPLKSIKLSSPVEYNGITYEKLEFDFRKLKGTDLLRIQDELRDRGKTSFSPIASSDFLATVAINACTADIGIDIYDLISFRDAFVIENHTKNFLLSLG